jgi:hypothetical protein
VAVGATITLSKRELTTDRLAITRIVADLFEASSSASVRVETTRGHFTFRSSEIEVKINTLDLIFVIISIVDCTTVFTLIVIIRFSKLLETTSVIDDLSCTIEMEEFAVWSEPAVTGRVEAVMKTERNFLAFEVCCVRTNIFLECDRETARVSRKREFTSSSVKVVKNSSHYIYIFLFY